MTLDFKKTLDNAPSYFSKTYIARILGRTYATVNNWSKGGVIPKDTEKRLIEILKNNDIKIWLK